MIKDANKVVDMVVSVMCRQAAEVKTAKTEVDISGGIDSAVVAALACQAFGKDNVIGVYSSINSSDESRRLARLVADKFGFKLLELDLSEVFAAIVHEVRSAFARFGLPFPKEGDPTNRTIFGGLRSCLSAPVGASHTDEAELKELTGVALTYTGPGGPMGTIEWASRENERTGCITRNNLIASGLGYDESAVISAIRRLEKTSRHKALPLPHLAREDLVMAGAVE